MHDADFTTPLELAVGEARARIAPQGAATLSWMPRPGDEWLSEEAGGIFVILPYNEREMRNASLPLWQRSGARNESDFAWVSLWLDAAMPEAASLGLEGDWWAEATVLLSSDRLDVELALGNRGNRVLHFTAALVASLSVSERLVLEGLQGRPWRRADEASYQLETRRMLHLFDEKAPRLYRFEEEGAIMLHDHQSQRCIAVEQSAFDHCLIHGFASTPQGSVLQLIAAQLEPLRLEPGAEWVGRQSLILEEL